MVGNCLFESATVFDSVVRIVFDGAVAEFFVESVVESVVEFFAESLVESLVELVVVSSMLSDLRTEANGVPPSWFL